MSSLGVNYIGKRRCEYDSSDSESEDVSPIKKIKIHNGGTNIGKRFKTKCKSIWQWIYDLHLSDIFKETINKKSIMMQPEVVNLTDDDDDDDFDALELPEVDLSSTESQNTSQNALVKTITGDIKCLSSFKEKPRCTVSDLDNRNLCKRPKPLSSSTPLCQVPLSQNSLQRKPINGIHSSSRNGKPSGHPSIIYKVCPVTKPGKDVDIILDDSDESDLEIINEVAVSPKSNHHMKACKYTECEKVNKTNELAQSYPQSIKSYILDQSSDFIMNGKGHPLKHKEVKSNSYTAHEVVRMQEKEQYKILLDKLVRGSLYHPAVSIKESKTSVVEIDLSDSESSEPEVIGSSFSKKVLQKPVAEFLQKYYKPCRLVSVVKPDSKYDDQEDEVKVLDVKLPEYKPKEKTQSEFFSPNWIAELKMTIDSDTQRMLQTVAEEERKIERYRKRRDERIADQKRLKEIIDLKADCVDEFPALTSDMEEVINNALGPGASNDLLCSKDGLDITRADIATLNGLNWLNDQVINFYLALITERSKLEGYPSVYNFSTFFYTSLKTRGCASVMRWTRKVDIFSFDIVLVPLHLGVHWALCVIDNRKKTIRYYDSMRSSDHSCLLILQSYLVEEMRNKKKIEMDPNTYSIELMKDIPQQMNGSDCGMFLLKYAEYICRDVPITFTQENMVYFRQKMVYEIISQKML